MSHMISGASRTLATYTKSMPGQQPPPSAAQSAKTQSSSREQTPIHNTMLLKSVRGVAMTKASLLPSPGGPCRAAP